MHEDNFDRLKENLYNHTEDLVLETMAGILRQDEFSDTCQCDQCLLDIASYTLNRMPAKYIASQAGNINAKLGEFEQQYKVDLISTITKAIKIVANDPHHKE
jgi:competence protein ComFB